MPRSLRRPSFSAFRFAARCFVCIEIEGGDHPMHKTTLLALEKVSKSVTKRDEKRRRKERTDDDSSQATLSVFGSVKTDESDDSESEEEIELASFITSLDVDARKLNSIRVGPRRGEHTAFEVGQLYRRCWGIETAFRDSKQKFGTKPRSQCLEIWRFFFILCLLLYNCWVVLNLIVADELDHRVDEEIIWSKNLRHRPAQARIPRPRVRLIRILAASSAIS